MSRQMEELKEAAEMFANYLRKWHNWPMKALLEVGCDENGEPYAKLQLQEEESE